MTTSTPPTTAALVGELTARFPSLFGGSAGGSGGGTARPTDRLRVALYLSTRLGVDVRPQDVAEAGTVRRVADFALGLVHSPRRAAALHRTPGAPAPLSHVQERMYLAEQVEPGNPDHSIVLAYLLGGPLDRTALRTAVTDVLTRHPVLRTAYGWDDSMSSVQRVWDTADLGEVVTLHPVADDEDPLALARRMAEEWWAAPFTLERPPFRAALVPLGGERHLFLVNVHHIAFDGWSENVFLDDLAAFYRARVEGVAADLPPVPGYQAYVHWERDQRADWERWELPFWERTVTGLAAPRLDLPVPQPPGAQDGAVTAVRHRVALDAPVVKAALAYGRSRGASPLGLLLSSTGEALRQQYGAGRVQVGTIFSGRVDREFDKVVGCFVNPVTIPLPHRPERSRAERLAEDSRTVLECLSHARLPFDTVVRALTPRLGRGPWYEVLVLLHGEVTTRRLAPTVALRPLPVVPTVPPTTLTVEAVPDGTGGWVLTARAHPDTPAGELLHGIAAQLRLLAAGDG